MAEKGWGTNVSVNAENGDGPTKLEGWLDAVLEELATPQKRPFEGIGEPPEAESRGRPSGARARAGPEAESRRRRPSPSPGRRARRRSVAVSSGF